MSWKRTFLLIVFSVLFGILYWQSLKLTSSNKTVIPASFKRESSFDRSPIETFGDDKGTEVVIADEPLFALAEADRVTRVQVEDLANKRQFVFERRIETWQMTEPIHFPLDIDVVRFLNALPSLRTQKKFHAEKKAWPQYGLDHPQIRLCISTSKESRQICYDFGDSVLNNAVCYGRIGEDVVLAPKLIRDLWLGQTEYALVRKQAFPVLFYDAEKITIREFGWFIEIAKKQGGWELARPTQKKLSATEVKEFFTLISNLHARSFLASKDLNQVAWSPNRRVVVEMSGRQTETLVLGEAVYEQSGFAARLSLWKTPFVISQEKYDHFIDFAKKISLGSTTIQDTLSAAQSSNLN